MASKRIEFVDLAKGVCITLVVLSHCKVNLPYLAYIRMPLYFLLSGLFFKTYAGLWNFTLRKINKILIPFLFFYLTSFLIYLLISHFAPGIRINSDVETFYLLDPLYSRLCVNSPLWFLLSLFFCNIIFYGISIITKNNYIRAIMVLVLLVLERILCNYEIVLPLYLNKSLYHLPFFFLGYVLKQTDLLYYNEGGRNKDYIRLVIYVILFFGLALIPWWRMPKMLTESMSFIISAIGVLALLFILKPIKKIPVISYYGRYSIIILCTSFWIYSPLRFVVGCFIQDVNLGNVVVFLITMALEWLVIKLCLRFLPHVTAQKDCIPVQ